MNGVAWVIVTSMPPWPLPSTGGKAKARPPSTMPPMKGRKPRGSFHCCRMDSTPVTVRIATTPISAAATPVAAK